MTRIAPKSGEPVEPTPRGAMTPKRRLELLLAYDGKCARCKLKISGMGWVANHIAPLALGGLDELGNLEPLHKDCDREVTPNDLRRIAKAKRQARMMDPSEPGTIKSRGFDRSRRRKMNGTVEMREEG